MESLVYNSSLNSTIYVFDLASTETSPLAIYETEPMFSFHHINACKTFGFGLSASFVDRFKPGEDGEYCDVREKDCFDQPAHPTIHFELAKYDDAGIIKGNLSFGPLDKLLDPAIRYDMPSCYWRRYTVDSQQGVSFQQSDWGNQGNSSMCLEMPRFNELYTGKPSCYVYGMTPKNQPWVSLYSFVEMPEA